MSITLFVRRYRGAGLARRFAGEMRAAEARRSGGAYTRHQILLGLGLDDRDLTPATVGTRITAAGQAYERTAGVEVPAQRPLSRALTVSKMSPRQR